LAQIEPSSVKASLRLTQTNSCDIMNNCEGSGKLSAIASQTFDLDIAVSGVQSTMKISYKSKYQVAEPAPLPI